MSNFLDKYLSSLHSEAAADSKKEEETGSELEATDAKEDNDKIGRIHDSILRIEKMLSEHLISKKEAESEEKEEAKSEEKEIEKDE